MVCMKNIKQAFFIFEPSRLTWILYVQSILILIIKGLGYSSLHTPFFEHHSCKLNPLEDLKNNSIYIAISL